MKSTSPIKTAASDLEITELDLGLVSAVSGGAPPLSPEQTGDTVSVCHKDGTTDSD